MRGDYICSGASHLHGTCRIRQVVRVPVSLEPSAGHAMTCRPPRRQFGSRLRGNGKSKDFACAADAHRVVGATWFSAAIIDGIKPLSVRPFL